MSVPHSADIFQAKSESLATLLPEIDRHKAALPNFQREWVWETQMVADLIVSVANRYPAGSLLTMPNNNRDVKFSLRPFSGSGDALKTDPTLMILDGQQRLTSLYQALYSMDGVRDRSGKVYYIYLNVKELMEYDEATTQTEDTFEQCIMAVQETSGQRLYYRGLRDYDDVSTREQEIELGYLPLYSVFNYHVLESWRDDYIHAELGKWMSATPDASADGSIRKLSALRKEWDEEVAPWITRIRDYRFPVIELNKDMELHAICHIFEKVNSTGVPLTVFELCTAILWAKGFHLNEEWDSTRSRLNNDNILRMQGGLDGTTFLQTISLLATLERKQKNPGSRVAVSMRREALLRLDKETVQTWWNVADRAYRDASRFMLQQGIIAPRILPYTTMLAPLAAILGHLRVKLGDVEFGSASPKIEQWYWCAVFGNRYSGTSETAAAADVEQVVNWVMGGQEPDVIRTFSFSADRLLEISTIRNVVYKGVLCLLAKNGAKDFSGEGPLSTQLFYDMNQDHHHIFPRAALDRLGASSHQRESIINKTLIGSATNRSIGGRLPSQYLTTLRDRHGAERMDEILRSHLIDPASLENDNWEQFLLLRRDAIKTMIETTCDRKLIDFSDGLKVSLPVQIQLVADSVRDVELALRDLVASRLNGDWRLAPDHIRINVDDRIQRAMAENPALKSEGLETVPDKLSYADLRELEGMITGKQTWAFFSDVFGTKEMLANRFRQIAPLRNASAHHREITDLERTDAEAAVIWFDSALTSALREQDNEVDLLDEEPDDHEEVDVIIQASSD